MTTSIIDSVIIIDEDPLWASVLIQQLHVLGISRVEVFTSAAAYGAGSPSADLVLLSYQLNEADGWHLFKNIRAQQPDTAIVFFSTVNRVSLAVRAIKEGAADFLIKGNTSALGLFQLIQSLEFSKPVKQSFN